LGEREGRAEGRRKSEGRAKKRKEGEGGEGREGEERKQIWRETVDQWSTLTG